LDSVEESLKKALQEVSFYGSGLVKQGHIKKALENVQEAISELLVI
jgi:hypothetical protein